MITTKGLQKSYGDRRVLDNLTFTVPEGEIFGFIGSNGAGKTTTIRILATLLEPDGGEAAVDGVSCIKDPEKVRRLIGYVPDFFGVYQRLTAIEYLEFYAGVHKTPVPGRRKLAEELLGLVGLSDRAGDQVDTLSRGLQQRLCLARALVHDPPVLLLDEPASGLDPRAQIEMRELIKELRRLGKTVLISSHYLPDLEEVSTSVGFIEKGRIVAAGPIAEVTEAAAVGRRFQVYLKTADDDDLAAAVRFLNADQVVTAAFVLVDHLEVKVTEDCEEDELLARLITGGFRVKALAPISGDLGDTFLRLTQPGEQETVSHSVESPSVAQAVVGRPQAPAVDGGHEVVPGNGVTGEKVTGPADVVPESQTSGAPAEASDETPGAPEGEPSPVVPPVISEEEERQL